ncbi:MAG: twin-arginine translocation signal domain-containing protein [Limisphaerales bacterium]
MEKHISRRGFVKTSLIASAAVPFGLGRPAPASAQTAATPASPAAKPAPEPFPTGRMGDQEFSRLIMGGNLIGGYSHSRDLNYVSTLMRRYNTDAKIRETLELGEANGITAINTYVMQENSSLFAHWKNGGKMKWFAQVRLDAEGGYSQIQKAVDEGAAGIHITGDTAESLLTEGKFEKVGETVELIKSKKRVAGVAAHDLRVIVECEKAKLDVDFYQKTFHSHEYFTAPRPGETDALGPHDNSWCSDPQAVVDVMATVKKPWIAFKILAAGAIQPRAAFPYAFNSGADFILVGMFDWQVEEDVKLARRVIAAVASPDSKRTRPWYGGAPTALARG